MINSIIREACVNNYTQAYSACLQGADRIELCDNIAEGGTTPSLGTIAQSIKLSKPIVVMIRPRGGNFVYSESELDIMKIDIQYCKQIKVKEIICGVLTENGEIDIDVMKEIITLASPMETVFHMALDATLDYEKSIQILIDLGIKRVLTKGGRVQNAIEGRDVLKGIQQKYQTIQFLAGGGITKDNYIEFCSYTRIQQVHGTRLFDL